MQNNAKKDKKRAARANLFFFVLLIRKRSVLHVQFVFCQLDLLILMPFSLPPGLALQDLIFFCLQVLLTRASLLALAKSIYYKVRDDYFKKV